MGHSANDLVGLGDDLEVILRMIELHETHVACTIEDFGEKFSLIKKKFLNLQKSEEKNKSLISIPEWIPKKIVDDIALTEKEEEVVHDDFEEISSKIEEIKPILDSVSKLTSNENLDIIKKYRNEICEAQLKISRKTFNIDLQLRSINFLVSDYEEMLTAHKKIQEESNQLLEVLKNELTALVNDKKWNKKAVKLDFWNHYAPDNVVKIRAILSADKQPVREKIIATYAIVKREAQQKKLFRHSKVHQLYQDLKILLEKNYSGLVVELNSSTNLSYK